VQQVLEQEKPRLLPLPVHRFDSDLLVPVRPGKTIYVRFDLNDYSIPPDARDKQLVLAVSASTIRILDGTTEVARHCRSYDRHRVITDPAHQEALLLEKRKAIGSTPGGRLAHAIPESEAFLDAAFQRGESAASQTTQLLRLLDEYGATELQAAMREALERNTPRASSVSFILNRRRRLSRRRNAIPVDLSRRPELATLDVQPHNPETYDGLTRSDDDDKCE
jgi:hypothetical protein